MSNITLYGAGAWGTALAVSLSKAHSVTLWARDTHLVEHCLRQKENTNYLPNIALPPTLKLSANLASAAHNADLHIIATPLAGFEEQLQQLKALGLKTPNILWVCKGIAPKTGLLAHEIARTVFPDHSAYGVLTGPSFALEVAQGLPTVLTLASEDAHFCTYWAQTLHQPRLRIYSTQDIIGAEVGGAVKNVIAIAAGVSDGLGFGLNARAGLITRGLAETARLAHALGANRLTLMGLSGMGDLILTCTGALSRNRTVGLELAKGISLDKILHNLGHVAEGVPTAQAVLLRARQSGIEMPICETVHSLLYEQRPAKDAVASLLARDPQTES